MPIVFGAESRATMVSLSATSARTSANSRATGVVEARVFATSTPAVASAGASARPSTSRIGGCPSASPTAVRSRVCPASLPAKVAESAPLGISTALAPPSTTSRSSACVPSRASSATTSTTLFLNETFWASSAVTAPPKSTRLLVSGAGGTLPWASLAVAFSGNRVSPAGPRSTTTELSMSSVRRVIV
jgi:hypothetical protein